MLPRCVPLALPELVHHHADLAASKHVGVFDELAFSHNELLNAVSERLQAATAVHASGNAAFDAIVDCLATLATGRTFEAVESVDADAAVPPCLPIWRTLFEVREPLTPPADSDGIQVDTPAQAPSLDMDGSVGETHAAAQAAEAAEAVLRVVPQAMPRNSADVDEDNGANSVLNKKPAHAPVVGAAQAVPNALPNGGVGVGMDEGSNGKVSKGKVMGTDPGGSDDDQEAALAALYAEFLNIDPSQVVVRRAGRRLHLGHQGRCKVQRTRHQRNGGSGSWLKEPWTAAGIGCRVWFWRCCLAASQAFVSRLAWMLVIGEFPTDTI
ncbi:hypothetical protein BC831DRAFT_454689 [Entophlyctis helioformis]|nr:hypothetical protein BC831DRAFT_454689 [Entophlyctis helioformis]